MVVLDPYGITFDAVGFLYGFSPFIYLDPDQLTVSRSKWSHTLHTSLQLSNLQKVLTLTAPSLSSKNTFMGYLTYYFCKYHCYKTEPENYNFSCIGEDM